MRMQVVGRLGSYISRGVSTVSGSVRPLGGAVDIVLVEQQDGSFKSSPWYVRFGKSHVVLRTEESMISINVNGEEANFHMYMDHKGQAFFLREVDAEEGESTLYPLSSGDETDILDKRHMKSRSFSFEDKTNYMAQGDMNTGSILARTTSDGSMTSGLFIADNNFQRGVFNADMNNALPLECAELAANLLEVKWSTNLAGHKPPRKDRVKFQKRKSQRDNMENSSDQRRFYDEACSNPDLEVPGGFNEDNGMCSSCSSTTIEVIFSEQKTEVITELPKSCDIAGDTEHDRKVKEVITDRTVSDLEVARLQLEDSIEKKQLSGEDVSGVRIMPGCGISEEEIPPDGVQPLVYSGMSKSSIGCVHCTTEQTHEVLYRDNKIGEAHTHAEILQATTVLPEVTKNEEVTENAGVMMPVMMVSQTSRQANCAHRGISKSTVADIEGQTALQKTQTINLDIGLCSTEKDGSNCVAATSQDSACDILKQPSFGKDDVKCLKPDDQLLPEESSFKDNSNLGDVKSTATNLPLGASSAHKPSPSGNWKLWPFSFRRSSSEKVEVPPVDDKVTNASESSINKDADENELKPKLMKKKVRVKTPTAEQLASLNLKEGRNTVTFTFTFSMDTLENEQIDAQIFLWKWDNRIVISDVDGTITKSDVLGQVMPLVGVDWSQTGVTHLFSAIKENGYKLLFLSARSISQAYQTRQFLINLKQDGKVLPDGPIVISPDGIFPSLYREVIRRAPHEFKISCLENIKALFPPESNPFYAGFGNRDTDEISYLKVGIPRGKIFIINPKGEIVVNRQHDTKSYTSLHALVNGMFPPSTNTNISEQEDFNSWNYWKLPPPVLN